MPCEVLIITSSIQLKFLGHHLRCESHRRMHVQVSYCDGPYDKPDGFRKLLTQMQEFEKECPAKSFGRLFYLALPPSVYLDVLTNIRCDVYSCLELLA
jgi:glucose-6-phosphate 1-dehydrogenase